MPVRRGQVEHRERAALGGGEEVGQELAPAGEQGQRGAGRQAGVDLLGVGVEADRGELQHPVGRAQPVRLAHPGHPRRECRVRDDHALRPAGRAGGVDDVRGARGIRTRTPGRPRLRPRPCRPRARFPVRGEMGDAGEPRLAVRGEVGDSGEPLLRPGVGDQQPGRAVGEHVRQPVVRIGGVQGEVRRPSLPDGEQRHEQFRGPVEADPHDRLGPGPRPAQRQRQPAGPLVKLGVRHPNP